MICIGHSQHAVLAPPITKSIFVCLPEADDVGFHNANGWRCREYSEPLETVK